MDIVNGIVLGVVGVFSVYDLFYKKVPVRAVLVFGLLVLGYRLFAGVGIGGLLLGLVPGVVLLVTAFCTGESIGYGDGMMLCVMGLFLGIGKTTAVLGMALFVAAVLAMVLFVMKRAGRKTELPFLPCLFSGYLISLLW